MSPVQCKKMVKVPTLGHLWSDWLYTRDKYYLTCQMIVIPSSLGVYTGGLRAGRLLPFGAVAGGVGATLQGNRKQVDS